MWKRFLSVEFLLLFYCSCGLWMGCLGALVCMSRRMWCSGEDTIPGDDWTQVQWKFVPRRLHWEGEGLQGLASHGVSRPERVLQCHEWKLWPFVTTGSFKINLINFKLCTQAAYRDKVNANIYCLPQERQLTRDHCSNFLLFINQIAFPPSVAVHNDCKEEQKNNVNNNSVKQKAL